MQTKRTLMMILAVPLSWTGLLGAQAIETRSTFHCLSLYWTRPEAGACTVEFRAPGESAWQRAQDLWYDSDARTVRPSPRPASLPPNDTWFDPEGGRRVTNQYRGSIVNLRPGTSYEIKLSTADTTEIVRAATRSEDFKIKKVVRVGSQPTFATTEGGSEADGFVLYDGGGDATIDAQDRHPHCVVVKHSHVIIRGFRLINASRDAVVVGDVRAMKALSHNRIQEVVALPRDITDVVIEDCDISQWGSQRVPDVNPRWSQTESGILVGSVVQRMVIQRNRIHHPRYTATLWNEQPGVAHPWGARGISLGHVSDSEPWEANHVVRYNEIVGDADHLLEDGICGGLNFCYTGTPGQDSDIYGNIITHTTDDLIEADGGGMNVRIWGNFFAHGLRFISLQNLPLGPVYIFRNVFGPEGSHLSTRRMKSPFKFLGNTRGNDGWRYASFTPFNGPVYYYHNTFIGGDFPASFDVPGDHLRNIVARNNIFVAAEFFLRDSYTEESRDNRPPPYNSNFVTCSFDYNLHNRDSTGDSVPASLGRHNIKGEPQWRSGHGPLSATGGGYQLAERAPGRNAGAPLANFNRGAREEGGAPDVGAHEYETPDMVFGIKARWP